MTDTDKLRAAIHGWRTGNYGHMEASFANQMIVDAASLVLAAQSAESQVEAARVAADEAWMAWTGGRSSLDGMEQIVRAALTAASLRGTARRDGTVPTEREAIAGIIVEEDVAGGHSHFSIRAADRIIEYMDKYIAPLRAALADTERERDEAILRAQEDATVKRILEMPDYEVLRDVPKSEIDAMKWIGESAIWKARASALEAELDEARAMLKARTESPT